MIIFQGVGVLCGFIAALVADDDHILTRIIGILCIGINSYLIGSHVHGDKPQAIDVYKGKTTLEITYKDSIPQDTIVVFKN